MILGDHGDYKDVLGTINARRLGSLYFAKHNNLQHCLCLDDNIKSIAFNGEISESIDFSHIYKIFQNKQSEICKSGNDNILLGAMTLSQVMSSHENRVCAKIWFLDLQKIFGKLFTQDLRCLGYKATDSSLWGEDIFLQLMLAQLFVNKSNKLPFENFAPSILGFTRAKHNTNLCKKNVKSVRDIQIQQDYLLYTEKDCFDNNNILMMCIYAVNRMRVVIDKTIKIYDYRYSISGLNRLLEQHYRINDQYVPVAKNITKLKLHQINNIKEILNSKEKGFYRGICEQGTGSGKSITQIQLAVTALQNKQIVFIVCPTIDLVNQFYNDFFGMLKYSELFKAHKDYSTRLLKLSSADGSVNFNTFAENIKGEEQLESLVVIACSHSFTKLLNNADAEKSILKQTSLFLIDECHHVNYGHSQIHDTFYSKMDKFLDANYNNKKAYVYGFTATPKDEPFFKKDSNKSGVLYRFDMYKGLLSGVVCPMQTSFLNVDHIDINNIEKVLTDVFTKYKHPKKGGIANTKTIIYMPNVEEYYSKAAAVLRKIDATKNLKIYQIHSGAKADKVKDFITCEDACVAFACGMLRLGFNDNNIETVIYLRNINADSLTELIQAGGRAARINPQNPDKQGLLVVPHNNLDLSLFSSALIWDTEEMKKYIFDFSNNNYANSSLIYIKFKSYLTEAFKSSRNISNIPRENNKNIILSSRQKHDRDDDQDKNLSQTQHKKKRRLAQN